MPIQLGARPDAGFDEPLRLLADCHRRIERFLQTLLDLAELRGAALLPAQREALTRSLDYFERAAPNHTRDEEDSLFPRLRAIDDPALRDALAQLDNLEADHQQADALWETTERLGRRWLRFGTLDDQAASQLVDALDRLAALYTHHIGVEERVVFAAAATVLGEAPVREIGREMAERRGLRWDPDEACPFSS